ncbi:class I SAM-dependent methyltransferase [Alicyclobacillus cycloheptanicus]|uniref:tRNA (Cmo5U34)-methyltransferase n=1 Tax=Alicyclobacillus cycloheptanicus TaxID=1457 RepID=A0ABT9XIR4_9BACL|nr:class I SAM-dependent methyltransferase [Alicyclobacillus cycloheptanicus]MDQ0190209.1 tRNA (cmo5U34)-methyltransferase [Alicyclobacillus cycloheptanicus]WDM02543.1 class I SAM-dependent methyltransferase [Alicyclobacillus cycloheptanicus]
MEDTEPGRSVPVHFEQLNQTQIAHYPDNIRALLPTYDGLFSVINAYLQPLIPVNAKVLVVGAGGGMELAALGQANEAWRFTAVDPSLPMLALAQQVAADAGVLDRVTFCASTLQDVVDDTPVQASYDAATCVLVLHFLPDEAKRALLRDIAARLKPGAPVVIVSTFGEMDQSAVAMHARALEHHAAAATGHAKLALQLRRNIESSDFVSEDRLMALLDEAGLVDPQRFFQTYCIGGWLAWKQRESHGSP